MPLRDLYLAHEGEPIWVIGTGPSLDAVDPGDFAGRPRIYLNRAAMVFGNAFGDVDAPAELGKAYWFTLDDNWGRGEAGDWQGLLERVRSGQAGLIGVWPRRLYGGGGKIGQSYADCPTGPNIITYTGPPEAGSSANRHQPELLLRTREQLLVEDRLYAFCGSAMTAVHLAWVMGAAQIILAGIDGTDGYAARVRGQYDRDGKGGFGYGQAKASALETAAALGLPVLDLSEGHTP